MTQKELKRKIVSEELAEIRKKKMAFEESIQRNVADADWISQEAEVKRDFTLLSQANDLRKANLKK